MEFKLYIDDNSIKTDYIIEHLNNGNVSYKLQSDEIGRYISLSSAEHSIISEILLYYIFDFYLKELILNKLYDEYYYFNTYDASFILSSVHDKLHLLNIKNDISDMIVNNTSFNTESYVLFNLKTILPGIYTITDSVAEKLSVTKEKDELISMIRNYLTLSFKHSGFANVEFADENECFVSFDNNEKDIISCDELLPYLAENSPDEVNIINSQHNPELAHLISEIFSKSPKIE